MAEGKISFINDQHTSSGTFSYSFQLYVNLKENGFNCDYYQFSFSNSGITGFDDIVVKKGLFYFLPNNIKTIYNFKLASNFLPGINWRVFKRLNSKYIFLSGPTLLPLSSIYKNTIAIGHDLYFLHENNDPKVLTHYMRKMYRLFDNATHIVVNSNYTKAEFEKYLGIENSKIYVIYPAFNSFIFHPGKSEFKNKMNLDPEDKIILSVGGDNPNKNIETVLQVMKRLPERFKLIRIGRNFNTTKLIDYYQLKHRIITFNEISPLFLSEIYRSADVLLFPSLFEGFGIPLVEAMATGVPVIASNRAAIPEVVGDAGVVCEPYDLESMEESILSLTSDISKHDFFAKKGINRSRIFSKEMQMRSISNFLEKIIN